MNPSQEPNQSNPYHNSETFSKAILVEFAGGSVGPGHPDFPERERQYLERRIKAGSADSKPAAEE